jgi:uncharacterized membrane protein
LGFAPGADFLGGSFFSIAQAVTRDGSVVVGSARNPLPPGPEQVFRWTELGGMEFLGGVQPGDEAIPSGVTDDGTIIVGQSAYGGLGKREAFRYSDAGGFDLLGFVDPGTQDISGANGISGDGHVIVGYSGEGEYLPDDAVENNSSVTAVSPQDAVAWYEHESLGLLKLNDLIAIYDPNVLAWDLREAKAVSADGSTIVGWGFNPDGFQEAWVWSLPYAVPEPSQGLMLAAGVAFLVTAARRRRRGV